MRSSGVFCSGVEVMWKLSQVVEMIFSGERDIEKRWRTFKTGPWALGRHMMRRCCPLDVSLRLRCRILRLPSIQQSISTNAFPSKAASDSISISAHFIVTT